MTGQPTKCTCSPTTAGDLLADQLHAITCLAVAGEVPHAMVDPDGDMFYPDSADDARWFAREHDAIPVCPDRFPAGWLP